MHGIYPTIALWITCGLVIVSPLLQILRKVDDDEFDKAAGFIALFQLLFLMGLTMAAANTMYIFVLLAAVLVYFVVIPWLGSLYTRELHLDIDDRYVEMCEAAVQCDARNAGSHALLAEVCLRRKEFAEAVTHYEMALTLSPDSELNPQYEKWVRRLEMARDLKRRSQWVWLYQRLRRGQPIRWRAPV